MLKILDRVELKYENLVLDEVLTKGENVFPPIELSGKKAQLRTNPHIGAIDDDWRGFDVEYLTINSVAPYKYIDYCEGLITVAAYPDRTKITYDPYVGDPASVNLKIVDSDVVRSDYEVHYHKNLKMWTKGNKLACDLEPGTKVYFFSESYKIPLVKTTYEYEGLVVVDIPDILLTKHENIKVQIDENDYYTTFEVVRVNKPADYDMDLGSAIPAGGLSVINFELGPMVESENEYGVYPIVNLCDFKKAFDDDMNIRSIISREASGSVFFYGCDLYMIKSSINVSEYSGKVVGTIGYSGNTVNVDVEFDKDAYSNDQLVIIGANVVSEYENVVKCYATPF